MSAKRYESLSALAVVYAFADVREENDQRGLRPLRSVCTPTVKSARAERIPAYDSGTMLAPTITVSTRLSTVPAETKEAVSSSRSGVPTVPAPTAQLDMPTLPAPANADEKTTPKASK